MPADEKNDEVEPTEVEETAAEETPAAEAEATETEVAETEAAEVEADETPAEVAEEPVAEADAEEPAAEEAPTPRRRSRAKKAEAEEAAPAEPKPARARREAPSANGVPVVKAQAKYVRTSARKARLVADHVRGKSVTEARAILAHTPRAVAEDWEKLLNSAVANAEHNHELLGDDLRILSITADEGPTLKRFRPRAMGRASRIRKRTSHLSIALTPKEQ
jgi:ribosomal protein L22